MYPAAAGDAEPRIDEFTRQCLAIRVASRLNSYHVIETLGECMLQHGVPEHVRSDNGAEMTARRVKEWLRAVGNQLMLSLELGEPLNYLNLSLFPAATRCATDTPEYRLLDEALSLQAVAITEVSEQGTVPELALTNNGDLPILLSDGEELIGAKQNQVLNLTVLAPAGATIRVPVSCVEAGRWAYESLSFRSSL